MCMCAANTFSKTALKYDNNLKDQKIKDYYSYRFCIGVGTGDLLEQWKSTSAVPNTARLRRTVENYSFSVINEIPVK